MYHVKTRNWKCDRRIFRLIALAHAQRGDFYDDGDGKFIVKTRNPLRAWATWAWWKLLERWSGGWTYIVRPGHQFIGDCSKSVF